MFLGFLDEGAAGNLPFQLRNASNIPVEPDAAPAFKIFGANGLISSGSGQASSFESGDISATTNNGVTPIVVTSAGHTVVTGQSVTVAGVGGNTAANGTFIAVYVSSTQFSLTAAMGNGAYTSGGTWRTTGLYKVAISGAVLASLEAGKTYTVILTWLNSGTTRTERGTFTVR